jgi:hypothetical protein
MFFQKRHSRHDLTGLAVATLRSLLINPSLLDDVEGIGIRSDSFYGRDIFPFCRDCGSDAGTNRLPV